MASHIAWSQVVTDSLHISGKNSAGKAIDKLDSAGAKLHSKKLDSLAHLSIPKYNDSTTLKASHKVDSIRSSFQTKADSLQLSYGKPINKMDSVSRRLQHKIDSLHSLRLPTVKLTSKLDSITRARTEKLAEMNQKMNQLKQRTKKGLSEVTLPPQMEGPVQNLSKSVDGYNIPMVNGKIPGIGASPGIPGLQLPSGNLGAASLGNIPGTPNVGGQTGVGQLNGITQETNELSKVTGQVGGYGDDVKKISQGNIGEVKNIDKAAESQVMKSKEVGELKGKTGEMDKYKNQLNGRPDSAAMSMVKQEAIKEATNHFKGQEAVLQASMSKMSKLKSKYSEIKSIADLPKKLPNPLHDTPFIERIIPGVTFQIISSNPFLLDVNVGALYRISPRFSAGAGWVQRLIFDRRHGRERMYGPRASLQFNLSKGFSLRLSPEVVNTYVPPQLFQGPDTRQRQWEWSTLVGIKKEFKVYKKIRGNTEALYNFHSPLNTSPYHDQFVVRFGFEFPMKKKVKSTSPSPLRRG